MKSALFSLWLAIPAFAAPVWKADGNRTLELTDAGTPIVRFVLDAAPRDPHFEILATADGRNTVWVGPPDHVWHYGLWFSWKFINGVNFWETDPKTGRQDGRSEILDPAIHCQADAPRATIRYRELSHTDPAGPAVLEDRMEIEIERPTAALGPQVTWHITTTALADVTLDRTPIPGEPGGKSWGGYGGFSWRGSKEFKNLVFSDAQERLDSQIHRKRVDWVLASGSLQDKPADLLFLPHHRNQEKPSGWYVWKQPTLPFWFVSPSLVQPKPLLLPKGRTIRHSYRVIVHQAWGFPDYTAAASAFAKSALK